MLCDSTKGNVKQDEPLAQAGQGLIWILLQVDFHRLKQGSALGLLEIDNSFTRVCSYLGVSYLPRAIKMFHFVS